MEFKNLRNRELRTEIEQPSSHLIREKNAETKKEKETEIEPLRSKRSGNARYAPLKLSTSLLCVHDSLFS